MMMYGVAMLITVLIANVVLKVGVGWMAYAFMAWSHAPEWAVIVVTVIAVGGVSVSGKYGK